MSLLNNLIEQIKAKEKLNYQIYINSIHNAELDEFYNECKENNEQIYPTWTSVEILSSRRKNIQEKRNNVIAPGTVFVIDDDDNDRNYVNNNVANNDFYDNGIGSRTRSKTFSTDSGFQLPPFPNDTRFTQMSIENFMFPFQINPNNIPDNVNAPNTINNATTKRGRAKRTQSNKRKKNNDDNDSTSQSSKSKRRNFFARGFFRGRGRSGGWFKRAKKQ